MLKTLVKKQLTELFRSFFVNAKKNTAKSKLGTIISAGVFALIMVGMLGGMFTALAILLCDGLTQVGMDAVYFVIMGVIALFLGIFGSVFNTYASLYKAKDNDLLLSLPIPVRTIMAARLMTVVLMSCLYSVVVSLPAVIVYLVTVPFTFMKLAGCIVYMLVIVAIVFSMSCLLGWVVAKISNRLKNKSLVTVLISLVALGLYYFVCFKAQTYIMNILQNAQAIGDSLKGSAFLVYQFGSIGAGDPAAIAGFAAFSIAMTAGIWCLLSRSFIKLATSSGAQTKTEYKKTALRSSGTMKALVRRELSRFTSSANYMLNCGLGAVFLPALGILMLIKGGAAIDMLLGTEGMPFDADFIIAMVVAMMCMAGSMIDICAPSVSLEGKTLWVCRSLPVETRKILQAKLILQLMFCLPVTLFCSVCCAVALKCSLVQTLFVIVTPLTAAVFLSLFGLTLGIKMPNLNWTNEMVAVKQGGAVAISLFGGWGVALAIGGLYYLAGRNMGFALYMGIATCVLIAADALLYRWIMTGGVRTFERL